MKHRRRNPMVFSQARTLSCVRSVALGGVVVEQELRPQIKIYQRYGVGTNEFQFNVELR